MVLRFAILIGVLLLAYASALFHVYQLQFTKGDYYLARAESQYLGSASANERRGLIYFTDKDGRHLPAALNKEFPIVYSVPKAIEDAAEAAHIVAPILGKSAEDLQNIFLKKNDSYEVLLKRAGSDVAKTIDGLKLKGIYSDTQAGRLYPLSSLASHLLGFVGPASDGAGESGHYGVEEFYDGELAGAAGGINKNKTASAKSGSDLTLTIDPNIQSEAEKVLASLIGAYDASGGTVIVEDPMTGKIIAMGSLPGFDPNAYASSSLGTFLNPATQKVYEPGSVFKVLTMAAGIDAGKITPDTTYYDTGTLTLNGRTIQNYDLKKHGPYGRATMTNVVEHSVNTGAVFAERQIGRIAFTKYMKLFGFSEKTGVDLPGEVAGNLRHLSPKERDIAFATASYGQGVATTPLELISAVSAIANSGNLMRPYMNADIEPKTIRRVMSAHTAKEVTDMMISAVDKAEVATISGYSIAGKTGTAFMPDFKKGGYTDRVIDSYVGFGPTSNPKFIILIKIDDLPSSQLAALSVVPAFRELAQFILNYYNVQPDRIGL